MSSLKAIKQFAAKSHYTPPTGVVVDSYSSSDHRDEAGKMWFWGKNGVEYYFNYSGHNSSVKAYKKCAPLTAIINKKAQAYINGKTWVLNSRGKESNSDEAKKLKALFKKPNPLQSWDQFEAQGYIYQQLFGYNIVLPIKPVGFTENIDATALWNIPPFMVDIEETKRLFYQTDTKGIIGKIVLNYKGVKSEIKVEDIYIMKDFTPSFDSLVLPESRICALELQINNIIGAYESRNVLINYRGALGILSAQKDQFGGSHIKPEDKEQLQNDFRRYGLKNNQWQFIITSAALKWQAMGFPTKDLMLFEEIEDCVMRICDGFNYPFRLMASEKSNSLGGSDVREFKTLLYQDAIIPEAGSIYGQWNQFFDTEKYSLRLDKDYSHLPILQADKSQEATARKTRNEAYKMEWELGLITRNQWRMANGEDTVPGDDLYIHQIPISNQPLAVTIGVGGVQGLIAVLTAQGMGEEARRATLEIVFGLEPAAAARMAASDPNSSNQNQNVNVDDNAEAGDNG